MIFSRQARLHNALVLILDATIVWAFDVIDGTALHGGTVEEAVGAFATRT